VSPTRGYWKIGSVSKPHGVRGEFVVYLTSDFPEWAARQSRFFVEDGDAMTAWPVSRARFHHGKLLLQTPALDSPEAVNAVRGTALYLPEEEARAASADPNYFFNADLIGLRLIDAADGATRGTVRDVIEMPAQNLLEIESAQSRRFLVPFVAKLIERVDLAAGEIVARLPEGLIDSQTK